MTVRKKQVMIVEDNQSISSVITHKLRDRGYDVSSVNGTSQAFDMFSYMYPDVIIFDSTTKGHEAVVFRSKVRAIPELEFVPFLFLFNSGYLKENFDFLGMDEYVITPFEDIDLLTRVDTVINRFENYSMFMELDGACKIFNKRKLMEKLDADILKNKRYGNSVTVIMFRLESSNREAFTGYNLLYKDLLESAGKIIKEKIRSTDYCGRYTLNSFVAVLTETPVEKGGIAAERIVEKFKSLIEKSKLATDDNLSLTAGISQISKVDEYSKNITDRISHVLRESSSDEKKSVVIFV